MVSRWQSDREPRESVLVLRDGEARAVHHCDLCYGTIGVVAMWVCGLLMQMTRAWRAVSMFSMFSRVLLLNLQHQCMSCPVVAAQMHLLHRQAVQTCR
jgi:hypothetical protein